MPEFRYRAVTKEGKIVQGEREASGREQLIEWLYSSGHTPVSAELTSLSGAGKARRRSVVGQWFANRTIRAQLQTFTRELATLLKAGLSLDQALTSLQKVIEPPLQSIVENLHAQVNDGKSLSEALAIRPEIFDQTYQVLVQTGEQTGALSAVLLQLSLLIERADSFRQKIVGVLIYPTVLLAFSLISSLVILFGVVPKFASFFTDETLALPLMSRAVFALSAWLQDHWLLILLTALAAAYLLFYSLQKRQFIIRLHQAALDLPLISTFVYRAEAARFCLILSTLLDKNVPIVAATRLATQSIQNEPIANAITSATEPLEQGRGLAECLQNSGAMPSLVFEMVAVGEGSGQLPSMLKELANIYEREVERSLSHIIAVAEPTLIITMGGFIGLIIVSLLTAVLSLNDAVF